MTSPSNPSSTGFGGAAAGIFVTPSGSPVSFGGVTSSASGGDNPAAARFVGFRGCVPILPVDPAGTPLDLTPLLNPTELPDYLDDDRIAITGTSSATPFIATGSVDGSLQMLLRNDSQASSARARIECRVGPDRLILDAKADSSSGFFTTSSAMFFTAAGTVNTPRMLFQAGGVSLIDATQRAVEFDVPARLPQYTVTTLPEASQIIGALVLVSNAPAGPTLCYATAAGWLASHDRSLIAASTESPPEP